MKKFLIFLFIISPITYSQTESVKWGKNEVSYSLPTQERRVISFENISTGEFLLKSPVFLYLLLISDVDGDNCPFHPSCSSFFVDAALQTNIFQGAVMFFDRFTRDTNFLKRGEYYPHINNNKLHDPPSLYTLNKDKIMSGLRLVNQSE